MKEFCKLTRNSAFSKIIKERKFISIIASDVVCNNSIQGITQETNAY